MAVQFPKEVKIALMGIAALVALIFGVNFLKGRGKFGSNRTFYAKYDNAQGLTEGGFVQLRGVTIGNVRKVAVSQVDRSKVIVEFLITDKTINIPTDSKAIISSEGLLTAKTLNINFGTSGSYLKDLDTVNSETVIGMMDKIQNDAGPILQNVDGTVVQAKAAIQSIDNTVNNINSVIDANTKANLQSSIAGLNKSVQDFNVLSNSLAAQRQKIANTISSLELFAANLNKNNAGINSTVSNINATTKKLADADINGTVNSLKNTLADLDNTIQKINSNQGSLGMLMSDKKLYTNMQSSLGSLDALLADLKARPSRYINFSVFGKKNRDEAPAVKPDQGQ